MLRFANLNHRTLIKEYFPKRWFQIIGIIRVIIGEKHLLFWCINHDFLLHCCLPLSPRLSNTRKSKQIEMKYHSKASKVQGKHFTAWELDHESFLLCKDCFRIKDYRLTILCLTRVLSNHDLRITDWMNRNTRLISMYELSECCKGVVSRR